MIDGPTLFDTLMAGSTMLFAGTTIWLAGARREALKKLDDMTARNDANVMAYQNERRRHHDADEARKTAIAALASYTEAEPTRFEAWRKDKERAHLKLIAVKGNQSPKRKRG